MVKKLKKARVGNFNLQMTLPGEMLFEKFLKSTLENIGNPLALDNLIRQFPQIGHGGQCDIYSGIPLFHKRVIIKLYHNNIIEWGRDHSKDGYEQFRAQLRIREYDGQITAPEPFIVGERILISEKIPERYIKFSFRNPQLVDEMYDYYGRLLEEYYQKGVMKKSDQLYQWNWCVVSYDPKKDLDKGRYKFCLLDAH
ncbi:MAG: hypothetical protein Q8N99_05075 [Nanoarchaeota archaeon]|nr:hypothetical protein [Nanoarchaeota archaeon]